MKISTLKVTILLSAMAATASLMACSPFRAIDPHAETNSSSHTLIALATKPVTVDEWMTLSAADRYAVRATMSSAERYAIWDQLTLEQKYALTEINSAYDALLAGDLGIKPANSPFSVNQWITKSPAERVPLRATLVGNGIDIWNALTLAQKSALTETNKAYDRILNATDLCAASGYPDIQYLDIPISFDRTVVPFYFGNETIAVAKFTVPENNPPTAYLDATFAEYQGPPTFRQTTISTRPCDFRAPDKMGVNGPISASGGVTTMNLVDIGADKPNPHLIPGQTYYMNVRNWAADFNNGAGGPSCQENTNCKGSFVIIVRH